ncbi:MAG: hypothetical protein OXE52_10245 [Chloroflexi bacterium]|nr:hypothetical protein [Chloroflexota bacterium]
MRNNIVLVFCCVFTLFLATVAQATSFSGNICYDDGANCQTDLDWKRGWCEAAIAQSWVVGSVDECLSGEAQTLTPEQRQARIQSRAARQNPVQDQNAQSSASSSRQSSVSSSRQSSDGGQGRVANQSTLTRSSNPTVSERKSDSSSKQGSDKTSNQWVRCGSWRVNRNEPGRSVCVNPAPSGSLPRDYSEREEPSSGGGTPR